MVKSTKAHRNGPLNSHELILMPTIAVRAEETDFAVSFAAAQEYFDYRYSYVRHYRCSKKLQYP
jgi:4-hydroxybutyryl-CoA dehydratase / vinylacetyl-CoA-Delta-isomerase